MASAWWPAGESRSARCWQGGLTVAVAPGGAQLQGGAGVLHGQVDLAGAGGPGPRLLRRRPGRWGRGGPRPGPGSAPGAGGRRRGRRGRPSMPSMLWALARGAGVAGLGGQVEGVPGQLLGGVVAALAVGGQAAVGGQLGPAGLGPGAAQGGQGGGQVALGRVPVAPPGRDGAQLLLDRPAVAVAGGPGGLGVGGQGGVVVAEQGLQVADGGVRPAGSGGRDRRGR